ncbi:hypothetical protein RQP46_004179 [Phenoliferia psychrophenolica]
MPAEYIYLDSPRSAAETEALLAHGLAAAKAGLAAAGPDRELRRQLLIEDLQPFQRPKPPAQDLPSSLPLAASVICAWIVLSASVVLMDYWILKELDFPYPVFLTTTHLIYAVIVMRLLHRFTDLLEAVDHIEMNRDRLTCRTDSIPFIQMLNPFTAVAAIIAGLDKFDQRKALIVAAIMNWKEAIQKLLQGLQMDAMVLIYHLAPVAAVVNVILVILIEGWAPLVLVQERVGFLALFMNMSFAFLLNMASVFLIGRTSSLVLTFAGTSPLARSTRASPDATSSRLPGSRRFLREDEK